MFTYFLMGVPFLAAVVIMDLVALKTSVLRSKRVWAAVGVVCILTAVFDQLLTGLPIVTYNEQLITGIKIWHAPIEDFMYTIAAVIGVASLGKHYEQRKP